MKITSSLLILLCSCVVAFAQDNTAAAKTTSSQTQATPEKAELKGDSNEVIAKKLSNPMAHIINMPFQMNWDYGGGPNDSGQHYYLQIQPVIPVTFNDDWSMISRSILYVENKHSLGYDGETGLGDFQQTFFINNNTLNKMTGMIFGAGPVFLLPTATENNLGSKQFGMGPSVVVVKELEKWTLGVLASQTWGLAGGGGGHEYVSRSFVQPFIAYHLPDAWTVTATSEYLYDWTAGEQSFPINLMVAKVVRFGKMPVSFSIGGRYYADKPRGGPDWGLRFMVTFVLPNFQ